MLTTSESTARRLLKKEFPLAYIVKMPDFKSSGSMMTRGLPDYLVINQGTNLWFEVKTSGSMVLNYKNCFTRAQRLVFPKLLSCGAGIKVLWRCSKNHWNYCWLEHLIKDGVIRCNKCKK